MRFLWVKMSVCLLGTANSSFPHCNLNCFVSSNARWHSSFRDYASSLWFQKFVIHEIGRQTWEGGILSSRARVMFVENNNGQSVAARGEGAEQPWQLDVIILKVQNTSTPIMHWVRAAKSLYCIWHQYMKQFLRHGHVSCLAARLPKNIKHIG